MGASRFAASRVQAQGQTQAFHDYREMYAQAKLDLVIVCLPPFAHGDEVAEAARRGIHLLVEKPIALRSEQAWRMVEQVEAAGIRILAWRDLDDVGRAFCEHLFEKEIGPVLTPFTLDPSDTAVHGFPPAPAQQSQLPLMQVGFDPTAKRWTVVIQTKLTPTSPNVFSEAYVQVDTEQPFTNLTPTQAAGERVRDVFMTMLQATGTFYVVPPGEVTRGVTRSRVQNAAQPTAEDLIAGEL